MPLRIPEFSSIDKNACSRRCFFSKGNIEKNANYVIHFGYRDDVCQILEQQAAGQGEPMLKPKGA